MKIGIKQISKSTGFSKATVSNALNHKKGVNKETAKIILHKAKELGYVLESQVRKIKFIVYKRSGKIIEDTPFFNLLLDGIEKECKKYGYEVVIYHLDRMDFDYEEQVYWLIHDRSSAIILLGTELMEDDIEIYRNAQCPFLLYDYSDKDQVFNSVIINNKDSAQKATNYILERGHRKIGYLRGEFRIQTFCDRAIGYRRALKEYNVQIETKYTFTLDTTMEGAYQRMNQILQRKPPLPTAFFADNDMIALGAMKALKEFGYRIPEDISIVGFDDLPFCEIVSPKLTTIHVSKAEMGAIAVRRMHEIIQHTGTANIKIAVCAEFIERESVKVLKNKGEEKNGKDEVRICANKKKYI